MKRLQIILTALLLGAPPLIAVAGEPPATTSTASPPAAAGLYELGKSLFDEYAPDEIKKDYEFPGRDQWDVFAARLQTALEKGSFEDLTAYESEARAALVALKALPEYADYAEWLEGRLDYIEASKQVTHLPPPGPKPTSPTSPGIPYYELWLSRMKGRPKPAASNTLLPVVKAAFKAEGVPVELAWLAESESSFNPAARSPAGARGLYQLMPETAKGLGLSTFLPDDRSDPAKSARAAAHHLKALYHHFGSWPLALAAYNVGEGRISRAVANHPGATFADIAATLPTETRMYVPKVLATVEVREKTPPASLAAPSA